MQKANLPQDSPLRSNGFPESSIWNSGFAGDAVTSERSPANDIQQQWFADVTQRCCCQSSPRTASHSFALLVARSRWDAA